MPSYLFLHRINLKTINIMKFVEFLGQKKGLCRGSPNRKGATYIGQHNHSKDENIRHAWGGIRPHDPSVRSGKDISCLTSISYCDWLILKLLGLLTSLFQFNSWRPMAVDKIMDVFSARSNCKLKSLMHKALRVRPMKKGIIFFNTWMARMSFRGRRVSEHYYNVFHFEKWFL
jgi:hypothetical protein